MYEYQLLIPEERVGVLVGEKGKIKRFIEKETKTKLKIDGEEVTIQGEDSYNAWICEQVIKAIGRGFNPKHAIRLTKDNYSFHVIDIMDYARNENDKFRLRGRVIGEAGRTREYIEQTTDCKVNVYGKTVGIIGPADTIKIAIEALEMLLDGANTSTVYRFLDKSMKKKRGPELD